MRLPGLSNLYHADSIGVSLGASSVAAAGSRLIGLARGIALAWLIPQAQFGLFGVALLVVNVLLPVCSVGLYEGVTRYAPYHESAGTLRRFVIRSGLLVVGLAVTATVALALIIEPLSSILFSAARVGQPEVSESAVTAGLNSLTRAALVCVLSLAAYQTFLGLLKGLRMFRALSVIELMTACLFTLLALLGAFGGFVTAGALIITYAVSCVATVVIFSPGLILKISEMEDVKQRVAETGSRRPRSRLLTYSLWAAGTAILWHALSYYPMWYLLKVSDHKTVGTFHAVRLITQFIHIGAVMLTAIVAANITRVWEHSGRETAVPRLNLLTKGCVIVFLLGATILALLRPLALWLFPEAFASGKVAYDPLVLFFLLVGVVGLVAVRFNLLEKPRLACLAWLVGAVVNVVASYLLLPPGRVTITPSNTAALQAAAWAGVIGASATLTVCVLLALLKGLGLDRPTLVLILAAYALAGGWVGGLLASMALITLLFTTRLFLSDAERSEFAVTILRSSAR